MLFFCPSFLPSFSSHSLWLHLRPLFGRTSQYESLWYFILLGGKIHFNLPLRESLLCTPNDKTFFSNFLLRFSFHCNRVFPEIWWVHDRRWDWGKIFQIFTAFWEPSQDQHGEEARSSGWFWWGGFPRKDSPVIYQGISNKETIKLQEVLQKLIHSPPPLLVF